MKKDSRRKDFAKIHIAKKQLGLDDDAYRAMLQMVAGVNSAAHLTATGRREMLAHLKRRAFAPGRAKSTFPAVPT